MDVSPYLSGNVQVGLRLNSEEGKVEAANKARAQAEADGARLREEHRAELEGQRVHYTGLLSKASSAQVCSCCIDIVVSSGGPRQLPACLKTRHGQPSLWQLLHEQAKSSQRHSYGST